MKNEVIKIRVETDFKEKTIKKAKSLNRSLSNYITDLIENDLKTTK